MNRNNLYLLSQLAKGEFSSINKIINDRKKLKEFRTILRINKLSGYFFSSIKETKLLELLPIRFKEEIEKYYSNQSEYNKMLLNEIEKLNKIFNEEKMKVIFLKGPIFTLKYYGDIGSRSISDIDILIKTTDDIDLINSILNKNDFILKSKLIFGKKLNNKFTHHYEYQKEELKLDLHWVLQSHFTYDISYTDIWNLKSTYKLDRGEDVYIMSDEYQLVFMTLSIFIDIQLGTIRFRSFIDLYNIVEKLYEYLDWDKYFKNRENEGLLKISINIFDLFITIFELDGKYIGIEKALDNERSSIVYKIYDNKLRLLDTSPFSLSNKFWSFKSYETHFLAAMSWWIISIPIKLSVYNSVFLKPVKKIFKKY